MPGGRRHLDRDLLHQVFWRRRDEKDNLRIHFWELSEELDISYDTVRFSVRRMADEGRIMKVAHSSERGKGSSVGIFRIVDPAVYQIDDPDTHLGARLRAGRALRWG